MMAYLVCSFLDAMFLAAWAVPNVYVGRLIESLHVTGIVEIVLRCLEIVFGILTLAPICIFGYRDVRIMVKRANRDIEAAGFAAAGPELPK
jgi:hypothetical protein